LDGVCPHVGDGQPEAVKHPATHNENVESRAAVEKETEDAEKEGQPDGDAGGHNHHRLSSLYHVGKGECPEDGQGEEKEGEGPGEEVGQGPGPCEQAEQEGSHQDHRQAAVPSQVQDVVVNQQWALILVHLQHLHGTKHNDDHASTGEQEEDEGEKASAARCQQALLIPLNPEIGEDGSEAEGQAKDSDEGDREQVQEPVQLL